MSNIGVQGLGEKLNEVEKSDLVLLKSSLDNLELTHLLTEGLSNKTLKMVNELTSISPEKQKTKKKI